jgi:hypothetical protein
LRAACVRAATNERMDERRGPRYTPTKLATSECKILLNIAQFNYQAFETTIVGSGVTDFISDIGEDDADKPASFGTTKKHRPPLPDVDAGADPAAAAALARAKANKPVGAGAVADAGADYAAQMNRRGAEKAVQRRRAAEEQKQQEDQAGPGAECVVASSSWLILMRGGWWLWRWWR